MPGFDLVAARSYFTKASYPFPRSTPEQQGIYRCNVETENPEGVNMGASNLRIRTEDIGKLGQLYLQQGKWNGRQLLSRQWVELATAKEIDTGKKDSSWGYGYGFQFWLNPPGGFRADGAYGQYSMVFPNKDTVVVITSESADKESTMHTVWDHLHPALTDQRTLPVNAAEYRRLRPLNVRHPRQSPFPERPFYLTRIHSMPKPSRSALRLTRLSSP